MMFHYCFIPSLIFSLIIRVDSSKVGSSAIITAVHLDRSDCSDFEQSFAIDTARGNSLEKLNFKSRMQRNWKSRKIHLRNTILGDKDHTDGFEIPKLVANKNSDEHISISGKVKKRKSLSPLRACLCGAFATIVGDFSMHPIDTIKVTQQSAATSLSFIGAAKKIFSRQGLPGFYQGVVPYLIGDGCSGAVKFAAFEVLKSFFEARLPEEWHSSIQFICAAGAFCACSVILVPGEVLKTKIQAGAASSLLSAISSTFQKEGIRGFFAGYSATLVRDVPYTMLELGIYENVKAMTLRRAKLKRNLTTAVATEDVELRPWQKSLAAAFTGAIAAFFTTPLDLIKTKLTLQGVSGGEYSGVIDAFSSLYAKGGFNELFVGSTARIAWLVPFTIIYLGTYEIAKKRAMKVDTEVHG